MFSTHEFHTPRNLYEKLIRDSEKLDIIINGIIFIILSLQLII